MIIPTVKMRKQSEGFYKSAKVTKQKGVENYSHSVPINGSAMFPFI